MPSSEERTRKAVEVLRAVVEDLDASGRERTETIEREAEASVARFVDARDELDGAPREIAALEKERTELPGRAYRLGLNAEHERDAEAVACYRSLKPALEALMETKAELEAEIAELVSPNPGVPGETHYDAQLAAYVRVRDADREAAPLVELQRQAAAILRDGVDPLIA